MIIYYFYYSKNIFNFLTSYLQMGNYNCESINLFNVLYFQDKNSKFILEDIFELNEGKNKLINVTNIDSENFDNEQIEEYLKSQKIIITTSSNINNSFRNCDVGNLENDSIPFFIFIYSKEDNKEEKKEDKKEEKKEEKKEDNKEEKKEEK